MIFPYVMHTPSLVFMSRSLLAICQQHEYFIPSEKICFNKNNIFSATLPRNKDDHPIFGVGCILAAITESVPVGLFAGAVTFFGKVKHDDMKQQQRETVLNEK